MEFYNNLKVIKQRNKMNIEYKIRYNGKITKRSFNSYKEATIRCHELICLAECMGRNSNYTIIEVVDGITSQSMTPHNNDLTSEEMEIISNKIVSQLV